MARGKKISRNGRGLLNRLKRYGLTRDVLVSFSCIAAFYGTAVLTVDFFPVSAAIIAVLGMPPALLIIAIGVLMSTLSQLLVDVFFLPVAIGYWLLIALGIARVYRILHRHLSRPAPALSHQKTKIVK